MAYQTARMRRLISDFVVRLGHETVVRKRSDKRLKI